VSLNIRGGEGEGGRSFTVLVCERSCVAVCERYCCCLRAEFLQNKTGEPEIHWRKGGRVGDRSLFLFVSVPVVVCERYFCRTKPVSSEISWRSGGRRRRSGHCSCL
jgi:hypothetical protein